MEPRSGAHASSQKGEHVVPAGLPLGIRTR